MNDGVVIMKKRGNNECGGGMKGKEGKGDFFVAVRKRTRRGTGDKAEQQWCPV